mgnify:CR=1 FL=1
MTWNWGPERAEAIRVLQEQIRLARSRLETIAGTADAQEESYEARDAADIDYGKLHREVTFMEQAIEKLSDTDSTDDARIMGEALRMLRRDVET